MSRRYTLKSAQIFQWVMKNPGRGAPYGYDSLAEASGCGRGLIEKLAKAHYVCMNIECDQTTLDELEHAFKFNDAVLRHLIVKMKKAETGPSPMMKEVQREEAKKAAAAQSTEAQA